MNLFSLTLSPSLSSAQRNVQNYLVLSLALADFMVALIVMPLAAFYELKGQWTLGMLSFPLLSRFNESYFEHCVTVHCPLNESANVEQNESGFQVFRETTSIFTGIILSSAGKGPLQGGARSCHLNPYFTGAFAYNL